MTNTWRKDAAFTNYIISHCIYPNDKFDALFCCTNFLFSKHLNNIQVYINHSKLPNRLEASKN